MPSSVRQERRQALHKLSRSYTLALSAMVGMLSGLVAVLFRLMVEKTEELRGVVFESLWRRHHLAGLAAMVICGALLGAGAAWVTRRFCPEAGGSGIPHVKAVLVSARRLRGPRLILTKLGGGLLALAGGMSLGREGPTVHIGGGVADIFARLFHLPARTRRALIAAGAGAGLAAAFNAPLAGFLFIMEELRRDMSRATYGNALVSSVAAVGVTRLMLGYKSSFTVPDFHPLPLSTIPALVLLGVLASLVGIAFNKMLLASLEQGPSPVWKGALAGAIGGVLALTLPQATGGGNTLTQSLLLGEGDVNTTWRFLLVLLIVKLLFTVLSYVSGVPGGIFAPLLTVGAVLGTLTGVVMDGALPYLTPAPERMATIGMAAVLTASVRAPLTGVVLIVEMTGQYHTLYSLLLASLVSYSVSERLGIKPIYEALLARDLDQNRTWVESEASVLELVVEPGSHFDGSRIDKLHVPEELLIAIVERNGRGLVPHGNTRLLAGDELTVIASGVCPDADLAEFTEAARSP